MASQEPASASAATSLPPPPQTAPSHSATTCCETESKWQIQSQYNFQLPVAASQTGGAPEGRKNGRTISCNSCRRRKTRCDKTEPCRQCRISFEDCIYSEPVRRRKKRTLPASRIDRLEQRLKAMEATVPLATSPILKKDTPQIPHNSDNPEVHETLSNIDEVADETGPSEMGKCATAYHSVEQGEIEFQGYSADRTFIQSIGEKLGDWTIDETHKKFALTSGVPGLFDTTPRTSNDVSLPPRSQALSLVEAALDAQILLNIVHRPSFDYSFNMVYSLDPAEYSPTERKFLQLLYAVFAFGRLIIDSELARVEYKDVLWNASRYYCKSKQLQDIDGCKDLISLQALIFMNIFLLHTTRISTCYTYLSTTLSIALRMGLHRSISTTQDMISRELACVGLPRLLRDEEIDQELPLEVNDKYIQKGRLWKQPDTEICHLAGANAYKRLHILQDRVIREVYPQKPLQSGNTRGSMSYAVKLTTIRQIEDDLLRWSKDLPCGFRLGTPPTDPGIQRAQLLLCMTFAHIQTCLYRPFLHYVAEDAHKSDAPGKRMTSCARACIQASQNLVALYEELCKRRLTMATYWPGIRILFSCILTIFYTILMTQGSYQADSLFKCLATGRKIVNHFAKSGVRSSRCKVMLTMMISTLPEEYDQIRERMLNFEDEVPNIDEQSVPNDGERQGDDSYLAKLAEQVFSVSSATCKRKVKRHENANEELRVSGNDLLPHERVMPSMSNQMGANSGGMVETPTHKPMETPCSIQTKGNIDGLEIARQVSPGNLQTPDSHIPSVEEMLEARPLDFHAQSPGRAWLDAFDVGNGRDSGLNGNPSMDFLTSMGQGMTGPEDFSDFQMWLL